MTIILLIAAALYFLRQLSLTCLCFVLLEYSHSLLEAGGEMEASTDVMDVTWVMETTEYEEDQPQQPYYELYTAARFITGLILYPIICLFGLTGNALIIVVLAHKVALSSTDVLLTPSCICLRLSSSCTCLRLTTFCTGFRLTTQCTF